MSKLDLATRILTEEHGVWAMFPGEGKKFLDHFRSHSMVFLDVPGIDLNENILQDQDLLKKHVGMARKVSHWHKDKRKGSAPSRNPRSYRPRQTRSFISAVGNVRSLYTTVKKGDLILVADRDMYSSILIGEVKTSFRNDNLTTFYRYENEKIPFIKVRWLPVQAPRRSLSRDLSNLLSNQHAIISIRDSLKEEIYAIAYRNYVFSENAQYQFAGELYSKNALATVPAITLISYFIAAYNAYESGDINHFSSLNVNQAINDYFEQDILNYFQMNFNSPGWFTLGAKAAAMALAVAAAVAATSGALSYEEAQVAQISNSLAFPQDACTFEAEQAYRAIMEQMGSKLYNELQCLNREAQAGVGLTTGVKVTK